MRGRAVARMRLGGGAHDREFGCGLLGVVDERAGQQPRAGQLAPQQRDARGFVERQVVRLDAGDLQQIGDDARVDVGVLPQIQRGEVEAAGLDRADQPAERAAGREQPAASFRPSECAMATRSARNSLRGRIRLGRDRRRARRRMAGELVDTWRPAARRCR